MRFVYKGILVLYVRVAIILIAETLAFIKGVKILNVIYYY